jgi:arginine-tRNA-protein transferase
MLDPETLTWDVVDGEALALFDRKPYVSLSRERRGLINDDKANNDAPTNNSTSHEDGFDENTEGDGEDGPFLRNMPGIPSLAQMMRVDMDHFPVRLYSLGRLYSTSELAHWEDGEVDEIGSLKSCIAELVAAVGPELMSQVCLDFCRRK